MMTGHHLEAMLVLRTWGAQSASGVAARAGGIMSPQRAFSVLDQLQTVGLVKEAPRRGATFFELSDKGWRSLTNAERHTS